MLVDPTAPDARVAARGLGRRSHGGRAQVEKSQLLGSSQPKVASARDPPGRQKQEPWKNRRQCAHRGEMGSFGALRSDTNQWRLGSDRKARPSSRVVHVTVAVCGGLSARRSRTLSKFFLVFYLTSALLRPPARSDVFARLLSQLLEQLKGFSSRLVTELRDVESQARPTPADDACWASSRPPPVLHCACARLMSRSEPKRALEGPL